MRLDAHTLTHFCLIFHWSTEVLRMSKNPRKSPLLQCIDHGATDHNLIQKIKLPRECLLVQVFPQLVRWMHFEKCSCLDLLCTE